MGGNSNDLDEFKNVFRVTEMIHASNLTEMPHIVVRVC